MSRTVSAAAKQALFGQETDEAFLMLLTIDHEDLAVPIRVANNVEDVVSRGDTYVAFAFEIDLPGESAEALARPRLRIDNVDRQIVDALRLIDSAPSVVMEIVMASTPDTVEAGPFNMTLERAQYDELVVTGELAFEDILNEPFPGESYTPDKFPGLF